LNSYVAHLGGTSKKHEFTMDPMVKEQKKKKSAKR
jgi:hypothetical protein